jgi:HK97 family phage prohead protease
VFNSESRDLGGFTEVIEPSALDGVVAKSDVLCLLNHNEDKGVLARCNMGTGSLTLEVDVIGLRYSFEAPNTNLGDELLEGLRRGDISASSFAFKVGEDKWTKRNDGSYLRTISIIERMYDVSPVYRAAYDATTVSVDTRGLDEAKARDKKEMEDYYKQLREGIK